MVLPGPIYLTEATFEEGLIFLVEQDADLALILEKYGPPPMWLREPGFPTLVKIILEQQVSLASAQAAYDKLLATVSPLTPVGLLELDDTQLKAIGFSRQKAGYVRYLAQTIITGQFDPQTLAQADDMTVRTELIKLKGIGNWTADIYMMMALGRLDIWPKGDLALAIAAQQVKHLPSRPTPDQLEAMSLPWQPWRAIAARLLWHHYLGGRGSEVGGQGNAGRKAEN